MMGIQKEEIVPSATRPVSVPHASSRLEPVVARSTGPLEGPEVGDEENGHEVPVQMES